jgi:dihydroneopterin aldolase
MHTGPKFILGNLSVDIVNKRNVSLIEEDISKLTQKIKSHYPLVKRVFIEAEAPKVS